MKIVIPETSASTSNAFIIVRFIFVYTVDVMPGQILASREGFKVKL